MEAPHVNAIGLTVSPEQCPARPRGLPRRLRIAAAALAILFAVTVVSTSVVSMGAYCLTSDGGDTRELPRP
jgi:hypothetical protein